MSEARPTRLLQHLVALIKNEDTNASKSKCLVPNQSLKSTGSTDNDMGAGIFVLDSFNVLVDGSTAIEDASLDVGHVFTKSVVLIANLVGQLTSVTHDDNRGLAINGLNLLQSGQDEDSGLSET
jgi:hypothetical protein